MFVGRGGKNCRVAREQCDGEERRSLFQERSPSLSRARSRTDLHFVGRGHNLRFPTNNFRTKNIPVRDLATTTTNPPVHSVTTTNNLLCPRGGWGVVIAGSSPPPSEFSDRQIILVRKR